MSTPPPVRPTGDYAYYKGRCYEAIIRRPPKPIGLKVKSAHLPSPDFRLIGANEYVRDVSRPELDRLLRVTTRCSFNGGGPFNVDSIVGSRAFLTYEGTDREWFRAQPLTHDRQWSSWIYPQVGGIADVDQLTDVREQITELPLDAAGDDLAEPDGGDGDAR